MPPPSCLRVTYMYIHLRHRQGTDSGHAALLETCIDGMSLGFAFPGLCVCLLCLSFLSAPRRRRCCLSSLPPFLALFIVVHGIKYARNLDQLLRMLLGSLAESSQGRPVVAAEVLPSRAVRTVVRARSLGRSVARSVARSLIARPIARSIAHSIAR